MTPTSQSLNKPQHELILELLQRERYQLPSEIRRTQTTQMRDELRRRLEMVDELVERFSHPAAA